MNKIFILFSLIFSINILTAQNSIEDFSELKSSGKMPAEIELLMKEDSKDVDLIYFKEVVSSGKLLYGTAINEYIDKIIDHLLIPFPQLRKEVRCYVIKSTDVNAFAYSKGIILVNLGLIAQISNESELAFILAHEIAHYAEQHSYQKKEEITQHKRNKKHELVNYLRFHTRSREIELEADRIAFERYYSGSSYSFSTITGVFDVLQYHYLPFDEIPFPRDYVETSFYQFPDNYFLPSVNPIQSREDYIDTLSSHPNIKKRRESTQQRIFTLNDDGRTPFVHSEKLFNEIRDLARFECINIFLTRHQYAEAVYNIFFLKQNYPDNKFLAIAEASAFYGLSKHKVSYNTNSILQNYKQVEGEIQQVHYFFSKLGRVEANLLAIRFLWKTHLLYPDNQFVYDMCKDAAKDMVVKSKMSYADFSDYPMNINLEDIVDEEQPMDTTTIQTNNKYQRIKQQNALSKIKPQEKFKTANYMLVDLRRDKNFAQLLNTIVNETEDKAILDFVSREDKKNRKRADSLLIFNTVYGKYIDNGSAKNSDKILIRSKKEKERMDRAAELSAKKLKINYSSLFPKDVTYHHTEGFNHFCKLQLWKEEFVKAENTNMILYQCKEIEKTIDFVGYDKASLLFVYKQPAHFVTYNKIAQLFLYPAFSLAVLPFGVFTFALPRNSINTSLYIADLKTGKVFHQYNMLSVGENSESYLNAFVYDSFYQFKKGKGGKK